MSNRYFSAFAVISILTICACDDKDSDSGNDAGSNLTSGSLAITGTLESGDDTTNATVTADQNIELLDSMGTIVGSTTTDSDGQYNMVISSGTLMIRDESQQLALASSKSFTFKSTVSDDGSGKALGINEALTVDTSKISTNSNGLSVYSVDPMSFREIGAITGAVVFADSEMKKLGTDVFIPGKSFFVRTAEDGKFQLLYVPAGEHTVRMEKGSYAKEITLTVEENKTTVLGEVTISITDRTPPPLSEVIVGTWSTSCWVEGSTTEPTNPKTGSITVSSLSDITHVSGHNCLASNSDPNGVSTSTYLINEITVVSDSSLYVEKELKSDGVKTWFLVEVSEYSVTKITMNTANGIEVWTKQ